MLRVATIVVLATFGSGCALFSKVTSGTAGGADLAAAAEEAKKQASLLKEAGDYAGKECEPINTQELAWEEERAVGSAVSVSLAMKGGHFFIDGMVEKNPDTLNADLSAKKKVTLPDSAKNDLTAYLSVVGRNLARYSTRPELPWTFGVIESDAANAFSAPGGYVVVTTGLLKRITNEAQLAGVLSHEIAHVTLRHALKTYKRAKHAQCSVALTAGYYADHSPDVPEALKEPLKFSKKFGPGGKVDLDAPDDGFVPFVIKKVMELVEMFGNAKEDELAADHTALELVAFAGYDPTEYEKLLTSLGNQGGGFSNHPSTTDRVAGLKTAREGEELKPFMTGSAKPDVAKRFAVLK
jgi:hypothetical protein